MPSWSVSSLAYTARFVLLSLLASSSHSASTTDPTYIGTFGEVNEADGGALLTVDRQTVTLGTDCVKVTYTVISQSPAEAILKLRSPPGCSTAYLRLELWGADTVRVNSYRTEAKYRQNAMSYSITYARTSADWPKPRRRQVTLPALCRSAETVVLSCSVGAKTLSMCSTSNLSPNSGALIYRFGKVGTRPELVYPDVPVRPSEAFSYAFQAESRVYSARVAFRIREFTYTVYYEASPAEETRSGVIVETDDKRIAHFRCDEPTISGQLVELYKLGDPTYKSRDLQLDR